MRPLGRSDVSDDSGEGASPARNQLRRGVSLTLKRIDASQSGCPSPLSACDELTTHWAGRTIVGRAVRRGVTFFDGQGKQLLDSDNVDSIRVDPVQEGGAFGCHSASSVDFHST